MSQNTTPMHGTMHGQTERLRFSFDLLALAKSLSPFPEACLLPIQTSCRAFPGDSP
jgi:hypothetical protein